MENKIRSMGVSIIGGWFILQGLVMLGSNSLNRIVAIVMATALIVIAVGLLKLLNQARIAAIAIWVAFFAMQLFGTIISLIAINRKLQESINIDLPKELAQLTLCGLVLIGLSYFFTRPKVKEQFGINPPCNGNGIIKEKEVKIERKVRSAGVSIIGSLLILQGLLPLSKSFQYGFIPFILFLIFTAIGIGLLRLNNQFRIATIVFFAILFTMKLVGVTLLFIKQDFSSLTIWDAGVIAIIGFEFIGLTFFLTRPKVKEQFKNA